MEVSRSGCVLRGGIERAATQHAQRGGSGAPVRPVAGEKSLNECVIPLTCSPNSETRCRNGKKKKKRRKSRPKTQLYEEPSVRRHAEWQPPVRLGVKLLNDDKRNELR